MTAHRTGAGTFLGIATLLVLAGCSLQPESAGPAGGEGAEDPTPSELLTLEREPAAALAELLEASESAPVAVFKHSPICPISAAADARFRAWVRDHGSDLELKVAHIDVLAEKPLARGLVAELDIKHESPQALLFRDGELVWHGSHGAITGEALSAGLTDDAPAR